MSESAKATRKAIKQLRAERITELLERCRKILNPGTMRASIDSLGT